MELRQNMDPCSLHIVRVSPGDRDGKHIGYVQWHSYTEPRIVLNEAFAELSLSEVEAVLSGYRAHRKL